VRIRSLRFDAFGPFTDFELDFDAGGPALHLVHGRNEAGKSTALRGLVALLYGIDPRTRDAHLHPMPKLRISAALERAGGGVLEVSRRKGNKNTLLDASGSPLEEAVLRAALGGVGRELFETVFGLDHGSLRTGANALLEGKGDVGESLFHAGVGGRGIHHVLARLEKEADDLFAPRATKPRLNHAIAEFKEAKRQIAHTALSGAAWETQQTEIAEKRALRDELDARLTALFGEQLRLARHARVIPKLDVRAGLLAQREQLGKVPRLPEDARELRVSAQRTLDTAAREIDRLENEIAKLGERRDKLAIPAELEGLARDAVAQLAARLAAHRKASLDLPKREAELTAAEEDAHRILGRLGRAESLDAAEGLRVGADRIRRIRALATSRGGVETALAEATEALDDRSARLAEAQRSLASMGDPSDVSALAAAVERARKLGDVDERIAETAAAAEQRVREALAKARACGLGDMPAEVAAALELPGPDAVAMLLSRHEAVAREHEQLRRRLDDTKARERERLRALELVEAGGAVPTEEQLAGARVERDAAWARVREGADAKGAAGDEVDRAMHRSDDVADRLRREADRVTQHATITAELRAIERERAALTEALDAAASRARDVESDWSHATVHVGAAPVPPVAGARDWLARLAEARRLAAESTNLTAERDQLHARAHEAATTLTSQLRDGALGPGPSAAPPSRDWAVGPGPSTHLREVVERAARFLDAEVRREEARRATVAHVTKLEEDVAALARRVATKREAAERFRESWAESVAVIGLGAEATVEEANALLDELGELYVRIDAVVDRRRRIASIRRDAEQLEADATAVLTRHAPELADGPLESRIDELVERHERMRADVEKRKEIDHDVHERRIELDGRRGEQAESQGRIAALIGAAGVADLPSLALVEERVEHARGLERRVRELEEQLVDLGDGASIATLLAETRDADLVDVRKRLAVIEDEIEEVKEELGAASRDLGGSEGGLEIARKRSASDAAADAQAWLAQIHDLAHRYARTRIAAAFLRREIERYREKNQGPILSRANELFPKLTLGSFVGLRAGFGESDHAVLRCLRSDGSEVDVEGLSTATRDQLYLALRLATLEHHAAHDEPLPFVLDDVLVEFDDDRARAALAALGELATTTQVILFTHHSRIVELAREAVPEARLHEHDLDALRSPARSELTA
jgi:uncharacterized protein YhaN